MEFRQSYASFAGTRPLGLIDEFCEPYRAKLTSLHGESEAEGVGAPVLMGKSVEELVEKASLPRSVRRE